MANFHKGSEPKYTINLAAPGFDMNENDFDIEVTSANHTIKGEKRGTSTDDKWGSEDVCITRKAVENDGETTYEWYIVINTNRLPTGTMIAKTTLYIPDEMAYDGVRTDIAKYELGRLID